ncbi:hypothetical protein BsWGS_15008 [Bradybaena similaris]
MDLLLLALISALLCTLVIFLLKYLSLLHLITGHAYVLSKRRKNFSVFEMVGLFKSVKPFPISCQKGWKIDSYAHGHRVWFNFLTFPYNSHAPSIKVYAVFSVIHSKPQVLLQVLKNISQACEWKPGVISAATSHSPTSPEVPTPACGSSSSMSAQMQCVKEENLCHFSSRFGIQRRDAWFAENVVPTVSVEYKRFWHREDNGVCWLLQMNEKLQNCEFYLIQPVEEVDQCLVSIVTWSREHSPSSVDKASTLLSSLTEYMSLRSLQVTPLITMTLSAILSQSQAESCKSRGGHEFVDQNQPVLSELHNFARIRQAGDSMNRSKSWSRKTDQEKYLSILKYGCRNGNNSAASSEGKKTPTVISSANPTIASIENHAALCTDSDEVAKSSLKRSVSDGAAITQSRIMNKEIDQQATGDTGANITELGAQENRLLSSQESGKNILVEDNVFAHLKSLDNQCVGDLLSETRQALNINLELSADKQADSSGGWLFTAFEKNIVVLKKVQVLGSSVQSYLGKGFILSPPKTVWDALRNPHTAFTYDETLKKVDVIATIDDTLKIVYFYHENQQFLRKECCDMCVLQGERKDGPKYIITYSSIEHDKCPANVNVTRARVLPSGWIIEEARQDNNIYSVVTYLMQVDCGRYSENSESLPFQEMISHYPLSIADLQQYLKPAVQMLRQKSVA